MFSQNSINSGIQISTGIPYKVVNGTKYYFYDGNQDVFSIAVFHKKITLRNYDIQQMKELMRKEYFDFPIGFNIEDVLHTSNRSFLFYSIINKKTGVLSLYKREIDFNSFQFEAPVLLFSSTKSNKGNTYIRNSRNAFFKIDVSSDSSKISFTYLRKVNGDKLNLGIVIFDSMLSEIYNEETGFPYPEHDLIKINYLINNNGEMYVTAFNTKEKMNRIYDFKKNGTLKSIPVSGAGCQNYKSLTLRQVSDSQIDCFFFNCSNIINEDFYVKGLNILRVDTGLNIIKSSSFSIPDSVNYRYESRNYINANEDRKKLNGDGGVPDLKITDVFSIPDYGHIIVSEEFDFNYAGSGAGNEVFGSTYDDIYIFKTDSSDHVSWIGKLPRSQLNGADGAAWFSEANALSVFYTDNSKNAELKDNEKPKKNILGYGGSLCRSTLDYTTGLTTKKYLLNLDSISGKLKAYQFHCCMIVPLNEKSYVFENYIKLQKSVMLKIELK